MTELPPEIRITRITNTYLQDTLDEIEAEDKKPKGPTKAEKKLARKEAVRKRKMEEQKLVLRVSRACVDDSVSLPLPLSPCLSLTLNIFYNV